MADRKSNDTGIVANQADRGQVNPSAAQVYEQFFVPALFQEWPDRLAHAARIGPGQRILDVACGTGILARKAAERVGPTGSVAGLDINPGMLDVAKQKAPDIEWRLGKAESLPFDPNSFDVVASQFGFMFFEDRTAAIREMRRVVKPGGRMAVAVWDSLENTPGYAALAALLGRLFGAQAETALRAPFILGDRERLQTLFSKAGVPTAKIETHTGAARFPSIESWMFTDIKGWTLADMIDDAQYAVLLEEAQRVLQPFVLEDGSVAFDSPAHIVTVSM